MKGNVIDKDYVAVRNNLSSKKMIPRLNQLILTIIVLLLAIFIILWSIQVFTYKGRDVSTLRQVHILFRHGERTPSSKYPTDPHFNYEWPDGPGALTNKGKRSLFELGEKIRFSYRRFIPYHYSPEDLTVTSSYSPRCQMSAMTLLAGLYPATGSQVWSNKLFWLPIPVNPIPRNIDNMITSKAPCLAFKIEKKKSDKELLENLTEKQLKTMEFLSEKTNLSIPNIEKVESIYSILKIEDENSMTLPDWTKSVFPEPMRTLAAMNLASYTRTPLLKRLQGGSLLKEWLENMKTSSKKIHLYSGHDLTLVNLMRTIGLDIEGLLPDYGASFILELHHINGQKIVKALYYSLGTVYELSMLHCSPVCTLEAFNDLVSPYIPTDWKEECNNVS